MNSHSKPINIKGKRLHSLVEEYKFGEGGDEN
jgi:hypothetical protein